MNLQHERMLTLCEALNLPFVAQGYPLAAQDAAQQEAAYSDFLEGAAAGRGGGAQREEADHAHAPGGLPGDQDAGRLRL